jgi:hypothetical protein
MGCRLRGSRELRVGFHEQWPSQTKRGELALWSSPYSPEKGVAVGVQRVGPRAVAGDAAGDDRGLMTLGEEARGHCRGRGFGSRYAVRETVDGP